MVIRDYEYDNYTFLCAVAEGRKMISGQLHELWTAPNAELSCATVPHTGQASWLFSWCGMWQLRALIWDDRILICQVNKQQPHSLVMCVESGHPFLTDPHSSYQVDVIVAPPTEEGAGIGIGEWVTDLDQAWVSLGPVFVYVASALYFQKALESSCGHSQHPCSTLAWILLSGHPALQKFHSWNLVWASQWPWE